MKPFRYQTLPDLVGKMIQLKGNSTSNLMITGVSDKGVKIYGHVITLVEDEVVSPAELLSNYEFRGGGGCGESEEYPYTFGEMIDESKIGDRWEREGVDTAIHTKDGFIWEWTTNEKLSVVSNNMKLRWKKLS